MKLCNFFWHNRHKKIFHLCWVKYLGTLILTKSVNTISNILIKLTLQIIRGSCGAEENLEEGFCGA